MNYRLCVFKTLWNDILNEILYKDRDISKREKIRFCVKNHRVKTLDKNKHIVPADILKTSSGKTNLQTTNNYFQNTHSSRIESHQSRGKDKLWTRYNFIQCSAISKTYR